MSFSSKNIKKRRKTWNTNKQNMKNERKKNAKEP